MRRKGKKKFIREQKLVDERSLYYIIERDLDREAIFKCHDGWYSQVSFGKGKRIDYVVKYGNEIYGIEVKKSFPYERDFEQVKKYSKFLNGVFLAYPANVVGQAIYLSELKESFYPDVGLISIALFRSHIIRKAKQTERQHDQIWRDMELDDKEYLKNIRTADREPLDRLSETVLENGCFWVAFNRKYKRTEGPSKLSFTKRDWKGLAILYGAHLSTSVHRFFSINELYTNYCKDLGWKGFDLTKLELCNLAVYRGYGTLDSMWSLSEASFFFLDKIQRMIKKQLGKTEWKKLNDRIDQWRREHEENQKRYREEFIKSDS